MRALLIAGGTVDIQWAGGFVKMHNYDKIIAVDGGLSAANLLRITPDIIVGDFDTVDQELLSHYEKSCIVERLNPVKDDTDTQYAINRMIELGADEIHIIGGGGGRMDHMLSNIYMLKMAHEKGVRAIMYDEINKISIVQGKTVIKKDRAYGRYISFIQLEKPARDVTFTGFKYNVEHFDFDTSIEYRMGVSNEFAEDIATIDMADGMFVMIEVSGE